MSLKIKQRDEKNALKESITAKIILSMMICIALFSVVSALDSLGAFKQNSCVQVKQVCASCTYLNISVAYPNSSLARTNIGMTNNGGGTWMYMFCNTTTLGRYDVTGQGDISGVATAFSSVYFDITPSGNNSTSNIVFFVFIIIAFYTVTLLGFFGKNIPISIVGGMAMMGLGVYIVSNGVIIFRDWLTNYFAYLTIGVGAIIAFMAIIEQLDIL